jgi:predicted nucleic acid-binding protein
MDKFKCIICNKQYSTPSSLSNHKKIYHNEEIEKKNNKYQCKYCNKSYIIYQSKWIHEKKCKIVVKENNTKMEKILEEVEQLKKEILLKNKVIEVQDKLIKTNKLTKKTFKSVNKILMNTNKIVINICNVGMENVMDVITEKDKLSVLNAGYNSIGKLTEIVHCGKYNQFKNIILTNLNGKYAEKYDKDKGFFIKVNQNYLIDDVFNCRYSNLQDIFDEFKDGSKISVKVKRVINEVIEKCDTVNDIFTDEYDVKYKNYKEYIKNSVIKPKLHNCNEQNKKDIETLIQEYNISS